MAHGQFVVVLACLGLAVLAAAQTEPAKQPVPPKTSGVAEGLITHKVNPKYPKEARDQGIQGDVLLQVTIDTKGNVTNPKAVQGNPILAAAAVEAVKQWKYRPYVLNGEPVQVDTTITIRFHL